MDLKDSQTKRVNRRKRSRAGFILIIMTASAIALLGALGLAVDLGRTFITKNEAQAYADSEALAAALALNGKATGITNAINAVTSSSSNLNYSGTTQWNFNTCSFISSTSDCTSTTPTVEFSNSPSGPWYGTAADLTNAGIALDTVDNVRVIASVNMKLYFLPVVRATPAYTQVVNARAIAGQVAITSFSKGLAPFTAVATSSTGPYFGLTPGQEYTIQWPQYNTTQLNGRGRCTNGHPEQCFVRPPCAGDLNSQQAMQSVTQHWGSQINGYWGYSDAASIRDTILGTLQLTAVPIGYDLQAIPDLSNGNMASTQNYLDDKVNSDTVNYGNDYIAYLNTANHNGNRVIVVPMVEPVQITGNEMTLVRGYGQFLLMSNASMGGTSDYYFRRTGNEPYCAIYMGPFNLGSLDNGSGGSSTGASRVRLVE